MSEFQIDGDSCPQAGLAAERRAWVRYSCDEAGVCQPVALTRESQWPARVRNISCGGIALVLPRRFERGTLLSVEIQRIDGALAGTLLARVVHVLREADDGWVLGCELTSRLSEADLQSLQ